MLYDNKMTKETKSMMNDPTKSVLKYKIGDERDVTMFVSISAIIFSILIGIVILFQLALAAGMPLGSYAMGGKFPGKYPPAMRLACLIQVIILTLIALIVLSKSGLIFIDWYSFTESAIWFVVAFSMIATIMNLITRSVWERRIWAPVSLLLLITSIIVAIG